MAALKNEIYRIELTIDPNAAEYLLNQRRSALVNIETTYNKKIQIRADFSGSISLPKIVCYDERGSIVRF
jgi:hypothetical protein